MSERIVDMTRVRTKAMGDLGGSDALACLWGLPVREEIVRCRDCEHYAEHEWVQITDMCDICHFFANGVKVNPYGFCAWGKRRKS